MAGMMTNDLEAASRVISEDDDAESDLASIFTRRRSASTTHTAPDVAPAPPLLSFWIFVPPPPPTRRQRIVRLAKSAAVYLCIVAFALLIFLAALSASPGQLPENSLMYYISGCVGVAIAYFVYQAISLVLDLRLWKLEVLRGYWERLVARIGNWLASRGL